MNTVIDLPNALRQLPLEAPAESAWPGLQQRLPQKRSWPKPALALVASTALAVLLWQTLIHTSPQTAAGTEQSAQQTDIQSLMDHSARLETAFYAQQDDAISSASVIAANLNLEAQLSAIDARLQEQPAEAEALALWRERVAVLDQGIALNRANAQTHDNGQNFDLALASLN